MFSYVDENWIIHTVPKTVTRFVNQNNLPFMATIRTLTKKVKFICLGMWMGQIK